MNGERFQSVKKKFTDGEVIFEHVSAKFLTCKREQKGGGETFPKLKLITAKFKRLCRSRISFGMSFIPNAFAMSQGRVIFLSSSS